MVAIIVTSNSNNPTGNSNSSDIGMIVGSILNEVNIVSITWEGGKTLRQETRIQET